MGKGGGVWEKRKPNSAEGGLRNKCDCIDSKPGREGRTCQRRTSDVERYLGDRKQVVGVTLKKGSLQKEAWVLSQQSTSKEDRKDTLDQRSQKRGGKGKIYEGPPELSVCITRGKKPGKKRGS